jgi:hypothetical protein
MANYAKWRAVSTTLADESERWEACDDPARVLWLQLLLLSDNYGAADADPYIVWKSFTANLGWTRAKTERALEVLIDVGLVHVYDTRRGPWLHLADFDDHQHYEYLRKRGPRRGEAPPCSEGRPGCRFGAANKAGRRKGRRKGRHHNNNYKDNYNDNIFGGGSVDDPVQAVFDHWVAVDVATGGGTASGRILNAARRSKIQARLAEGYTVEQLKRAISAFCNDPWHCGQNDRRTRYTGLVTLLKNGEKVEAGLRLADAVDVRKEAAGGYVRPQVIV